MKRILRTSIALAILMVCHVASVSAQIRPNPLAVSITTKKKKKNKKARDTTTINVRI